MNAMANDILYSDPISRTEGKRFKGYLKIAHKSVASVGGQIKIQLSLNHYFGAWLIIYLQALILFVIILAELILQPFSHFTFVKTHSPTLPSLVTAHSPALPLLHLRHSSFSNLSFASPTLQDFHLRHLASRPCH